MSSKIDNLITLLDDTELDIVQEIEDEILKMGPEVLPQLQNAWEIAESNLLADRLTRIINSLNRGLNQKELIAWVKESKWDLFKGLDQINKIFYPEIAMDWLKVHFEPLRSQIWLELSNKLTALEKITIINHYLVDKAGLSIDPQYHLLPNRYFVPFLLSTKMGNESSISLTYLLIGRSLNLPIVSVAVDKIPVLAYLDVQDMDHVPLNPGDTDVLFYLLPGHHGLVLGHYQLVNYLDELGISKSPTIPQNDKILLRQLLVDLRSAFKEASKETAADIAGSLLSIWK